LNRFAKYSWGVLFYNLLVILWGAYVRATGSGAGCGEHWPTCNGQVIPLSGRVETMVEYTHRLMSGLTLILVVGLAIWAFRAYPRKSPVRRGASLSLLFSCTEALVGAGLVLYQLVAKNDSIARAASVAIHLVNTLLLLGALTLTAWWSSGGGEIHWQNARPLNILLGVGFVGLILLSACGAVTALGDTLFPASSFAQGLQQDTSPTAHFLIRLRVIHPMIAVTLALYIAIVAWVVRIQRPNRLINLLSTTQIGLFVLQLGLGGLNVILLAPIWMQMVHLLTADLVWICFVLLTSATFSGDGTKELVLGKPQYQAAD